MKLEEIKKHWEDGGRRFPVEGKITPTSRDPYLAELEEKNIIAFLNRSQEVLEAGCGDGFHTVKYAKKVKKILGFDLIEDLINISKARAIKEKIKNVSFLTGSVLNLEEVIKNLKFNCVISQRCLINLSSWSHQKNALIQIHQALNRNGLLLLTEGFEEEMKNLNIARQKVGLTEIEIVNYNKFLSRKKFEKFIKPYFKIIQTCDYGTYLFFSRFYHPLIVFPNKPKHDSKINRIAAEISQKIKLPDLKQYSYNLFYALRRK